MTEIRFDGRVALITGAGKGLGRAYATLLAARGAKVVVNNRKREPAGTPGSADTVAAEIEAAGGEAAVNYDSVESETAGQRMVEAALDRFGRLDILINNAGVDQHEAFHKTAMADFERIFAINFFGSVYVTRAALPVMREAGYGRVLVSTSSAGLYGLHGLASYSASKAALIGLMRALAQENAARGITVNAIAPYAVTQMTEAHLAHLPAEAVSVEQVAPVVAWLASEDCTINGETIIAGCGHAGRAQMVEGAGVRLGGDAPPTPEAVAAQADAIRAMSETTAFADAMVSFLAIAPKAGG